MFKLNKKQKSRSLVTLSLFALTASAIFSGTLFLNQQEKQNTYTHGNGYSVASAIAYADDGSSSGSTDILKTDMDTYVKPSSYPLWLQNWGPWAKKFRGNGSGEVDGNNWGCVVTSWAIQLARGGVTNINNSGKGNPDGFDSYMAEGSVATDKGTSVRSSGTADEITTDMGAQNALQQAETIAKKGDYPLIRVYHGQHTVAYWKAGNGKPLFYDPARNPHTGASSWTDFNSVGSITIPNGAKFSEDSPGPGDVSDAGSSSDSSKSDDSKSDTPKIKPIFNPFYTPTLKPVRADQSDSDTVANNAQMMALADSTGPLVLGYIKGFALGMAYFVCAYNIIACLVFITDEWLGGVIRDGLRRNKGLAALTGSSRNSFMGIRDSKSGGRIYSGVIQTFISTAIALTILFLIASGALSTLVAVTIDFIGNIGSKL